MDQAQVLSPRFTRFAKYRHTDGEVRLTVISGRNAEKKGKVVGGAVRAMEKTDSGHTVCLSA